MTIAEEKQGLRLKVRAQERALSPRYKEESDAAIADRVRALPDYREAHTVFSFFGTKREINTRPILEDVLKAGKRLCLPLCTEKPGIMELRVVSSLDDLVPGVFGILEPSASCPILTPDEVDFAVLPCLSCGRAGRRLGQGGGYYDRFLTAYRGSAVLLCREELLHEDIPVEPHDIPVPWVVTEKGLYEDGVPARLE
ncbi:5-formyltetrahydrofolate cyclo-ligase [Oscillibacter sp.]|uniref:5-formyltetrahydrofolate cyclo-ligase n=1 Tax=Oscillibacter sp. TaxID=1945593 RepID=UPI002899BD52|nr:5-formyltetrahydrofolate cyclo-ligase [Oscillibacter sp.]